MSSIILASTRVIDRSCAPMTLGLKSPQCHGDLLGGRKLDRIYKYIYVSRVVHSSSHASAGVLFRHGISAKRLLGVLRSLENMLALIFRAPFDDSVYGYPLCTFDCF